MSVTDQVKDMLIDSEFSATPADIAAALGTTKRQLTEILSMHGTKYLDLKREARIEVAEKNFGSIPQRDLAEMLGFGGDYWYIRFSEWRKRNNLSRFARRLEPSY